jgi:hypothetical protein
MMSAHPTQRSSLGFRFLIITPFLLITTLALDAPIARAESSLGSAPSGKKSLLVPSVITILTRGVPATPTQAQSGSVAGVGGVLRSYYHPVSQRQIYDPGDLRHSLLPSGIQLTLQLTIQKKNAQATISLQNPALLKAVL